MDIPEQLILEDLNNIDPLKRVSAMQKLITQTIVGNDISAFFDAVVNSNFKSPKNRILKLMAYRLLEACTADDSQWQPIVEILLKDLVGEDQELQLAALSLLNYLPLNTLKFIIFREQNTIATLFSAEVSNTVLRAIIDCFQSLTLQHSHLFKGTYLMSVTWELIFKNLLHVNPCVCFEAFSAVNRLLQMTEDECYAASVAQKDSRKSRSATLEMIIQWFVRSTAGRLRQLIDRLLALDITDRWVVISPITYLILQAVSAALFLQMDNQQPSSSGTANAVSQVSIEDASHLVETFLIPQLMMGDKALTHEAAKAILKIGAVLRQRGWIHTTITYVLEMLKDPLADSKVRKRLIDELITVLSLVRPSFLISVLHSTVAAICSLSDSADRVRTLVALDHELLETIVKESTPSESQFFADEWETKIWISTEYPTEFRNEFQLCLMHAADKFLSRNDSNPNTVHVVLGVLRATKVCLAWRRGHSLPVERYVQLVDRIGSRKQPEVQQYFARLIDSLDAVAVDSIFAQLVFVICKVVIRQTELVDPLLVKVKERVLNPVLSAPELLSKADKANMASRVPDAIQQALFSIALKSKSHKDGIINIFNNLINTFSLDRVAVENCRTMIARIHLVARSKKEITYTFKFFPPPNEHKEVTGEADNLYMQHLLLINRAAATLLDNSQLAVDLLLKQRRQVNSVCLSAPSHPLIVNCTHILNVLHSRVTFFFTIINNAPIPLRRMRLILGLTGGVRQIDDTAQVSKCIDQLEYQGTDEWDVCLEVFDFDDIAVHLMIVFIPTDPLMPTIQPAVVGGTGVESTMTPNPNYYVPIIRCEPYSVPPWLMLHPFRQTIADFLTMWNSFPIIKFVDLMLIDKSHNEATIHSIGDNTSFALVFSRMYDSKKYFQAGLCASTWTKEPLLFTLLGNWNAQMSAWLIRADIRSYSPRVVEVFSSGVDSWLQSVVNRTVELLDAENTQSMPTMWA